MNGCPCSASAARSGLLLAVLALAATLTLPCLPAAERIVLIAGGGVDTNSSMPLNPTQARLSSPFGVDFDRAGNLYLVELTGHYVRRLDAFGKLSVIAGT